MAGFCTNKATWSTPEGGTVETHCGRCDACRQQKLTETVGRCLLEDEAAPYGTTFLTLTYADTEEYGATEVIEEGDRGYVQVQLMFKKLRKMHKAIFRYVVAMEQGTQATERTHFHALIFWYTPPPDLEHNHEDKRMWEHWPHGFTHRLPIEHKTAVFGYLCKYMLKAQTIEEMGNPKTSGGKRSGEIYDPKERAIERYTRYSRALAAGYDNWNQYKMMEKTPSTKTVWWSKVPTLGAGHSSLSDEANPLALMARRLVKQGLPFSLEWTHPNGFYYKGEKQVMVRYYLTNDSLIAEYYRHYCREYFLRHGRGDPPISNKESAEGNNQRETVLKAAYGLRTTVLEPMAAELDHYESSMKAKLLAIAPLPTKHRNWPRFKKEFPWGVKRFSSAPDMYFYKRRDGRIIAVKESETITMDWKSKGYINKKGEEISEPLTSQRISAYALDQFERPKTKVFQRWPVGTIAELLRLAKGSGTETPPHEER